MHELIRVRDRAGISARALGRTLTAQGFKASQGTMSRIEQGHVLPSIPMVRAWLEACGVDEIDRDRIADLAEAAHGETRPWRELLREERHLQDTARGREQNAVRVRNFQPTIIPGLLQTPEYAARLMPLADVTASTDIEAALAARLQRQQVLHDESRQFQFVMTEQVLRWAPGPRSILAAQLDRIASLARLDSVDVAVVPIESPALVPWHNFVIWESPDEPAFVTTELVHGEQELHDPNEVALYTQLWDRLWSAAAHGDEARALIRGVLS
jgi:hypothetical protein